MHFSPNWELIAAVFSVQLLFALAAGALLRRRLKRLEMSMARETAQIEALLALEKMMQLAQPLPPSRGWSASPDLLRELAEATLRRRPQSVLECGAGISTIVLARALQRNGKGHLYSLEHDARFAEQSRQRLAEYGLSDWASIIHAPLVPASVGSRQHRWYDASKLPAGNFDLMVIDGPPTTQGQLSRYPAGPILFGRLNVGALVFLDDARRADEQKVAGLWQREFPEFQQRYVKLDKGLLVLDKMGAK